MINKFFSNYSQLLLLLGFLFYLALSWVLFFREERTINVLILNYPLAASFLNSGRIWLLSHYLNSLPTVLFIGLIFFLFLAYLYSLKNKLSAKKVIVLSIVFQAIVFFSYPFLSTDIFDYINSDRLAVVYHQNVWQVAPSLFPGDKFFPLINYPELVRIYGPVNQAIYSIFTFFSGDDIFVNLIMHKLVVFIFVLGSLWLVDKILQKYFPNQRVWGLKLVFWNPLFVIETIGSGHNDILMLFFLLGTFLFFKNRQYLLAGAALALSIQVKTLPLILLPFVGIFFLREKKIREGFIFAVSLLVIYWLTFLLMNTNIFAILTRQNQTTNSFWQSLPFIFQHFLPFGSSLLKFGLVVVFLFEFWRVWKGRDPWLAFLETLFLYLLFFLPTLWNWYFIWILVFLPFYPLMPFSAAILGATFGSLIAYGVDWIRLRVNYRWDGFQVIMYLTILSGAITGWWYVLKKPQTLLKK